MPYFQMSNPCFVLSTMALHFRLKLLFANFESHLATLQALCLRASGQHEVPQKHEAWQVAELVAYFEATVTIQFGAAHASR